MEQQIEIGDIIKSNIMCVPVDEDEWQIINIQANGPEGTPIVDIARDGDVRWQEVSKIEFIRKGETVEAPVATENITALGIRVVRDSLGLSRRDVERGTGLAGSVVWRAEQDGKTVTDEQRRAIWNFLTAFKIANPTGKSKPVAKKQSVKKTSDGVAAVLAKQELERLQEVIEAAIAELDKQITEAKKLKRPVAPLKAVHDILAPKSE